MTDTTTVVALPSTSSANSYVEWGPVIGGAVIASAISFVLLAFGTAGGFASVSPYSWNNPSATTLSLIGVIWFLLVMIGSTIAGGYFAGRFRRPVGDSLSSAEAETRDGGHGLLVWGVGLLLGASIALMAASATVRGAATAAGGAATLASQNVSSDRLSGLIDTMMRPGPQSALAPGARPDDARAVVSRLMSSSVLTTGQISDEDRAYIARVVSAQAGVPEDEARRRVDATIEQAKQAANQARKAAAILAFLIGATSIVSAGAAYWAATAGGAARDRALRAFA